MNNEQFCDQRDYQKRHLFGIMLLYSYDNLALKTQIGTGQRKRMGNIRICGVVFDLERSKNKDCPLCHDGEHLAFENNK